MTDPLNVHAQRDLGLVLNQLGDTLEAQGDADAALECFQEAHALLRPLRERGALEAQFHGLVDRLAQRLAR